MPKLYQRNKLRVMSDEDKLAYAIQLEEMINNSIKKAITPLYYIFGIVFSVLVAVVGYNFLQTSKLEKESTSFATKEYVDGAYLQKMQYYQIEEDEHRMLLQCFPKDQLNQYIFGQINDNIANSLGFKYTTRGK